jgi:hypothetical protein
MTKKRKKPSESLPPQAYENDTLPDWEEVKRSYSKEHLKWREKLIAKARKVAEQASKAASGPGGAEPMKKLSGDPMFEEVKKPGQAYIIPGYKKP